MHPHDEGIVGLSPAALPILRLAPEERAMREFEGKTAVVTGAASGMGRAFAERFAREGMHVVLADIEEEALETAVRELEQQEHRVIGVVTNTMSCDSVQALAQRAIDEFGKVHVVCNNAGVTSRAGAAGQRGVWEIPQSDWDWVVGVNFWGVLFGLQVFVPHMIMGRRVTSSTPRRLPDSSRVEARTASPSTASWH